MTYVMWIIPSIYLLVYSQASSFMEAKGGELNGGWLVFDVLLLRRRLEIPSRMRARVYVHIASIPPRGS